MRRLLVVVGLVLPALALGQTTRVLPSDSVQSACVLNAANAACVLPLTGKSTAGFIVTAVSSPTGITLVSETSRDGTNWDSHGFADMDSGETLPSIPNASLAVGFGKTLILGGGDRYVRVRASAWTSGSATVAVTGTDTQPLVKADVDRVVSGCVLGADEAVCTLTLAGKMSAGFVVTAVSSPTGITLKAESSRDGVNWDGRKFADADSGERITTIPNASIAVGYGKSIILGGGDRYVRVRADTWTSGNATIQISSSTTPIASAWPADSAWYSTGSITTTTLVQMIAAPAAGLSIYLTSVVASASVAATTTTDQHIALKYGTGTNCGTGTTYLMGAFNSANGGYVWSAYPGTAIKIPAANALCLIHAATGSKIVNVTYYIGG